MVLEPPSIKNLSSWEGAFVSSTSRLMLPVDEITITGAGGTSEGIIPAPGGAPEVLVLRLPRTELVQKIDRLVLEEIEKHSERIM